MDLRKLLADGGLRRHRTSAQEIRDLLRVVDRDLADASVRRISSDRRFITAYNAALTLATMVLHAAGYRAVGAGHHWTTIQALGHILGPEARARTNYLNSCRMRRNTADYDRAGTISETEADQILTEAEAFRADVLAWLHANHPDLLGPP